MFFSRRTIKYDLERFANLCGVHLHEDQSIVAHHIDTHNLSIIDKVRQKGVSMMLALEGLMIVCEKTKGKFNKKTVVYICRNSFQIEYKIQKIMEFYNKLDVKLKPIIDKINKHEIHFSSGSKIVFAGYGPLCGVHADLEIIDEIKERDIDDLYSAAVTSMNKNGKIIISSSHAVYTKLPIETNTVHI